MATVRVTNSYACGRQSTSVETVRDPMPGEPVEDWWALVVQPVTGDGHPCGSREHAYYVARIEEVDDPELLPGDVMTWEG